MTKFSEGVSPSLSRRHFVIGGLLMSASGIAYGRQPESANPVIETDDFESWVPSTVGPWQKIEASGVVLPPPDALSDRLYDNLVTRVYEARGLPTVMVLLAYNNAQDGVLQVHRPEVCYPAGGFALSQTLPIPLDLDGESVPANIFTAEGPDRTEQVVYFTRLGSSFPRSWLQQRTAVIEANLRGDIPDGILTRASILSGDQRAAQTLLTRFMQDFYLASKAPLRRLMVA